MRYELMFPDQIRKAIDENTPVALAVGVLEYHSEHLTPGVDTLLPERALQLLEKEHDMVIFPTFYYGASSYVVEKPERNGSVHVASEVLQPFARQLFYNLLRIGFRNIHIFIHHQSENFAAGMPTDLSFKLAARQETFAFLERERGEDWWGDNASADYYDSHNAGDNPFNWIQIHPFMSAEAQAEFPIDHAGEQETSLMMAFCPEGVDMSRFSEEKWYAQGAKKASLDYGNRAKEIIMRDMKKFLEYKMTGTELIRSFQESAKRYHLVGNENQGVLIGLDLEGRLFVIIDGEVVNRVNIDAIKGITDRKRYINPGGDGLWPAPEGTCLGYEYAAGIWRVPPGLTNACYKVIENDISHALIEAEVDLVNASGIGIPTIFRRDVSIMDKTDGIAVKVTESIEYIGAKTLSSKDCMLAPWSLAQFDCCPGCEVVIPLNNESDIWDMYDPSRKYRYTKENLHYAVTDGSTRYQIGIAPDVEWIELKLPSKKMKVKRTASPLKSGQDYIDIIDAPPTEAPGNKKVRYSVYTDTSGFMEIEAAGGCPKVYEPGTVMSVEILTEFLHYDSPNRA